MSQTGDRAALLRSGSTYREVLVDMLNRIEATDEAGPLPFDEGTARAAELIDTTRRNNSKALVVGNGGSAAIAAHMQVDLTNAVGMRAVTFYEGALLTCMSNDYGYEEAFERLTDIWIEPGDLLVAISSSGRSRNILRTADLVRSSGGNVITLSGFEPDNPLRSKGTLGFYVPSTDYGPVETVHQCITHICTDLARGLR